MSPRAAAPAFVSAPLPHGPGFFELRHTGRCDGEPLLAAVCAGANAYPAGVNERPDVAGQRRLVVQRELGQVPLPDFAQPGVEGKQ